MDPFDDILRRGHAEYHTYVNPVIAQRAMLAGEPVKLPTVNEEGVPCFPDGTQLEDFHGTQAFGHRHPHISASLKHYLDSSIPNWVPSRVNPFIGRLARRLAERTGYDNAFFAMSGADAVEAAIKMARALTRKPRILGLERGYHGCSMGALSVMGAGYLKEPFGPHLPGAENLPFGDVEALERALSAGDVACVIVEPIQGEGGVRVLPPHYIEALCTLTQKHSALLIADEIQTGLGRTGRGFLRSKHWPREPEIVLLAKHLGGGIFPLSVMLTRKSIFMDAYGQNFAEGEAHNSTFSNNAFAAVAGLATLDLLDDALLDRIGRVGETYLAQLRDALQGHPLVEEVRGEGLMSGVKLKQLDHPWLSFEHFGFSELEHKPVISPLMCHRLYKRGFFCFTCGHDWSVFRVQPRFTIPEETLSRFVSIVKEELDYIHEELT